MKKSDQNRASRAWPAEMRQLAREARIQAAMTVYDLAAPAGAKTSPDDMLYRARLELKLNPAKAVRFLLEHRVLQGDTINVGLKEMYLGMGYARMREFAQADQHFNKADSTFAGGPRQLQLELICQRAHRYLAADDIVEARIWQRAASADPSLNGKIHAEYLRSLILDRQEKYLEEARSVLRVLKLIGTRRADHLEMWYAMVHTLAGLARELPFPEAASAAERELASGIDWSPDFEASHFQALKAVGWCKALSGDYLSCFRFLRRAQRIAPSPPWAAMLLLDRAYLARCMGELTWAANEVHAAEELLEQINWESCRGEERVALLLLAELIAERDPEKAAYFVGLYEGLPKVHSPFLQFSYGRRLEALSAYTAAIVSEANGRLNDAVSAFTGAWSTFDRIGYAWRAGRAATRLFKLTGKSTWRRLAKEKLESHYQSSWLWKDLRNIQPQNQVRGATSLTPSQERIFRMICSGMSIEAIAAKLRRSKSTVRNHLKVVFKAFGVRSQPALVALAAKRHLI